MGVQCRMGPSNSNTIREDTDFYASWCDETNFLHTSDVLTLCFGIQLSIYFQSSVQVRNKINDCFIFIINIETNCWFIFMGDPDVWITLDHWNQRPRWLSCGWWSLCYCSNVSSTVTRCIGIKSW